MLTAQTILNWRRVCAGRDPHLLPPLRGLPDLVHDLVHRLKVEWPRWGTRRIAGQLARLGVKASRRSVQRILRRGPRKPTEPEVVNGSTGRVLLAKRPDHIWMIDFTRVGGVVRPLWIGAVIDAFSRRVLAIGAVRGGPSSAFAVRLLRDAIRKNGTPRWLVTDKDPVLRGGLVQRLLTRHGILRRYGAVGRKGSIALIERTWERSRPSTSGTSSSTARSARWRRGSGGGRAGTTGIDRTKASGNARPTTSTAGDDHARRAT